MAIVIAITGKSCDGLYWLGSHCKYSVEIFTCRYEHASLPRILLPILWKIICRAWNKPALMAQLLHTDNKSYADNFLGGLSVKIGTGSWDCVEVSVSALKQSTVSCLQGYLLFCNWQMQAFAPSRMGATWALGRAEVCFTPVMTIRLSAQNWLASCQLKSVSSASLCLPAKGQLDIS